MRVIDGMHRLAAAKLRGRENIAADLFYGDDAASFLRAVEANIRHGLPLTLKDREVATLRILKTFPNWSNRAIGSVVGLSDKTVGAIRLRHPDAVSPLGRLGRDGRVRPSDRKARRAAVSQVIVRRPNASLRSIAQEAGVSPNTVRAVRRDILCSETRALDSDAGAVEGGESAAEPESAADIVGRLQRDPALRYSERGRTLLRWLEREIRALNHSLPMLQTAPDHCVPSLVRVARSNSAAWDRLADLLEAGADHDDARC